LNKLAGVVLIALASTRAQAEQPQVSRAARSAQSAQSARSVQTAQVSQTAGVAPAAATNPMATIADVYAWMMGSNIELVMDVSPLDDGSHSFDPSVQYVFHLTSKPGLGFNMPGLGTETRVILQFASSTSVQGWVTDATGTTTKDYVTGDPSNPAGITSIHGKIRVFAGPRSDPRFFNATGFASGLAQLGTELLPKDGAGCPVINAAQSASIRNLLITGGDTYDQKNVMAIVVAVDKSLVNLTGNTTVAVWGSTHAGS
jgi:hypothetical protein